MCYLVFLEIGDKNLHIMWNNESVLPYLHSNDSINEEQQCNKDYYVWQGLELKLIIMMRIKEILMMAVVVVVVVTMMMVTIDDDN